MEYVKAESDGWYWLYTAGGCNDYDGEDLGRGGAAAATRFQSAEAREYFIQAREWERISKVAARDLRWLKQSILKLRTPKGRIRIRKLREMIDSIEKESPCQS